MSNKFDLERAKAGEQVEFFEATEGKWIGKWIPVRVIGARRKGTILVEDEHDCITHIAPDYVVSELRMAPKKVKVRYRNYMLSDAVHSSVGVFVDRSDGETPEVLEKKTWFRGWIHTDWQEVEVTE